MCTTQKKLFSVEFLFKISLWETLQLLMFFEDVKFSLILFVELQLLDHICIVSVCWLYCYLSVYRSSVSFEKEIPILTRLPD